MKNSKVQKRKVGVAGGFINQMMGNNSTEPVKGGGCTVLSYSDRHPYEVLEVSKDGNSCVIRAMDAKPLHNGITECQDYEYSSNPNFTKEELVWNEKKGCWGKMGIRIGGKRKTFSKISIVFGIMEKYWDPCF